MNDLMRRRLIGLALVLVGGLLLLSMALTGGTGWLGTAVGTPMRAWLGFAGFLLPVTLVFSGLWVIRGETPVDFWFHIAGFVLIFLATEVLLGALPVGPANPWSGSVGVAISRATQSGVGLSGAILVSAVALVAGLWFTRNDHIVDGFAGLPGKSVGWGRGIVGWIGARLGGLRDRPATMTITNASSAPEPVVSVAAQAPGEVWRPQGTSISASPDPVITTPDWGSQEVSPVLPVAPSGEETANDVRPARARRRRTRWSFPDPSILDSSVSRPDDSAIQGIVRAHTTAIEKALLAFKIDGRVVGATIGPRVILYEWQQGPGVRASKLEQLQDDLALALKAERVRVVVPLPGKGTIGIEVPNPLATTVTFGSVLTAYPDPAKAGSLPMFLGRLLTGEALMADLAEMPHLLIAGTTGSGKSVCIHDILASLIYTRSPDQLRLILIDPKMVELRVYAKTPHLLFPVITEAKRAVAALHWAVRVMEARYKLLAHHGARDLPSFNKMMETSEISLDGTEDQLAIVGERGLPWIVIAVDELADLMVEKAREVETLLQRLAQMARGVGIHLAVATQRPSVDVITGVIKANMPSRLAFQVSSQVDSRTIIDSAGAEQLLGKGDMLYLPNGSPDAVRAQGSYIAFAELKRLVEHWAQQGTAESIEAGPDAGGEPMDPLASGPAEDEDPLLRDVMRKVLGTGEASISMIQRHWCTGFSRAGRLMDLLERRGIVGPKQGSKPREIIVDREEYLRKMDEEDRRRGK